MIAENEMQDIEMLERQVAVRPGLSPTLYEKRSMDFSDVPDAADQQLWPEGKHPLRVVEVEEKVGKPKTDSMGYEQPGTPYVWINLECTEGACLGWRIEDRLMLAGKGLSRTKGFLKATGLLDEKTSSFSGCFGDFLGKNVWGTVETETRTYQGKEQNRSKIAFIGYEAAEAWGFPKEDEFDEVPMVEAPAKKSGGTPPWKQ